MDLIVQREGHNRNNNMVKTDMRLRLEELRIASINLMPEKITATVKETVPNV